MSKKSNKNALVHGVYSGDIILPWERAEDFGELLKDIRLDFMPNGISQDVIVFDIAALYWKKRRINRLEQLALLQSGLAGELKKIGKKSVCDIYGSLKMERTIEKRKTQKFARSIADLSDAMTSIGDHLSGKKKLKLGKLGAEVRSVAADVETLLPSLEAKAESQVEAEVIDRAHSIDMSAIISACELEARFDALIDKKIKLLILQKELQRQYGRDTNVKLIEHQPAKGNVTPAKQAFTKASRDVTKKSKGANDNWNDDENNNDNNDNEGYDWSWEYDEDQAEKKKARRERRARKG